MLEDLTGAITPKATIFSTSRGDREHIAKEMDRTLKPCSVKQRTVYKLATGKPYS